MSEQQRGTVVAVSRDDSHRFSKPVVPSIRLLAGYGIEGDSHAGATTQHRYLIRTDPTRPNLTQVHLVRSELLAELAAEGFDVSPASSARTSPPPASTCWHCRWAPGCTSAPTPWSRSPACATPAR